MVKLAQSVVLLAALAAAVPAEAQPAPPWAYGPPRFRPYAYRPWRFGPYGYRPRFGYGRPSYGTGYNGRGTATGGPAGGLPSRN